MSRGIVRHNSILKLCEKSSKAGIAAKDMVSCIRLRSIASKPGAYCFIKVKVKTTMTVRPNVIKKAPHAQSDFFHKIRSNISVALIVTEPSIM